MNAEEQQSLQPKLVIFTESQNGLGPLEGTLNTIQLQLSARDTFH